MAAEGMEGIMFRFSATKKNLVAFVTLNKDRKACKNALILIPGLTEGFMSMAYTQRLSEEILALDCSLVQVNLSSSFNQFGFSSLERDCVELTELLRTLKERFAFARVAILGHSTGAQDTLYYLRYGELASTVDAAILQAAVSDRDSLLTEHYTADMIEEAMALKAAGKENKILTQFYADAPITASRFLSLVGRLTPDDMFSVDLNDTELVPILGQVRVPILLCFSSKDEYVPDKDAQRGFVDRMVSVLKRHNGCPVQMEYFEGDHGLSEERFYTPFVYSVVNFLGQVFTNSCSEVKISNKH